MLGIVSFGCSQNTKGEETDATEKGNIVVSSEYHVLTPIRLATIKGVNYSDLSVITSKSKKTIPLQINTPILLDAYEIQNPTNRVLNVLFVFENSNQVEEQLPPETMKYNRDVTDKLVRVLVNLEKGEELNFNKIQSDLFIKLIKQVENG